MKKRDQGVAQPLTAIGQKQLELWATRFTLLGHSKVRLEAPLYLTLIKVALLENKEALNQKLPAKAELR